MKTILWAAIAAFTLGPLAAEASVSKSQRRLVIVSTLETFGMAKYAWLYNFLDASTISLGQSALGGSYQSVSVLPKSQAKRAQFVSTLRNLTNSSSVKAVDVILSVHGADEKMWFDDGSVTSAGLRNDLQALPKREKLRLMYSLACYGASHRNEFHAGGFRTTVGARKVNTASASEYPAFLSRWALGHTVSSIFALTNADPALQVSDQAAVAMGFSQPDSHKLIGGSLSLTLSSDAQAQ